jgi:CO dehydrogenase/acetyl-CoA synthase beta subunit
MAKKNPAKKSRTINQRFTALEGLVRFEFRGLRKEMNERFTVMEDRIDRLATHVDGFMKLHETLDIEVRVMKEQMNRFEERLRRIEAAQTS